MKVKILIEKDEDGWWVATVPSLPGVVSQGKTKAEAEKNIAEAIELHLETLLEWRLWEKQKIIQEKRHWLI